MDMTDELSQCLVLNTIATARSLLRRFDAQLSPFGVTVQQFALLAAIQSHPGAPVMTLAREVMMDRTSLTRNLDLLQRKGLVRRISATTGNVRHCELTAEGKATFDKLVPEWHRIGAGFKAAVPSDDADTYRRVAKRLSQE
ncbi:MarR family transcriptional regulator [uncultured Sphingomonas sp.]|uniref:MarR family winged helix-turn-helix transcriptional regulator n=1 Tax=uncultured Sphingomonas sp. TaxID=158754 RepID=UPI0025EB550F|nr:MarR family transcriptional regulator [uncultured Sphingomonas sp.]